MQKQNIKKIILCFVIIALIFFFYKINFTNNPSTQNLNPVANTIDSIPEKNIEPKPAEILGRAKVSFAGSTKDRIHNIELGLKRLDGKVIPAGAEFSFWQAFGPILATDGFKEANSFFNGEIISSVGGGVCQISSTLFQSAIEAGLPITSRTNHTFSVPFYRTGLDATVSEHGPDLKFLNDTGHDITIKAYTEDSSAVFELYGIYDDRMAKISKAKITDIIPAPPTRYVEIPNLPKSEERCEHSSQRGYTAEVFYNVLYKDGTLKEKTFNSTYQPFAKICYISLDPVTGCTSLTNYSPKTGIKCQK